jgi:hypothetical protein
MSGYMPGFREGTQTVAEVALDAIEALYGGEEAVAGSESYSVVGETVFRDISRARARARLEGKSEEALPSFPSADRVKDADRKKILARVLQSQGNEAVRAVIAALSPDEHLALAEEAEGKPELNAKLAPLANRVEKLDLKLTNEADARSLATLKGKPLGKPVVEQIVALSKQIAAKGNAVDVRIERIACLGGMQVVAREVSKADKDFSKKSRSMYSGGSLASKAVVQATLNGPEVSSICSWRVEGVAPAKPAAEKAPKAEEDKLTDDVEDNMSGYYGGDREEEFWQKLEEISGAKGAAYGLVHISVSGMPAREGGQDDSLRRRIRRMRMP